ncbi:hypothetical protein [Herbaspirillum camelliae]|uniref:hypothetical protein n=1 Tax=Herbaspirillum camelliae TaxID=1892903 RepID=UPI000949D368|nr:hypothetical protein [Herbaspirillum camelliae]
MPITAPKTIPAEMHQLFQIERGTTLKVRLNDRSSRRYEQCVLTRADDEAVLINCRDFSGSVFHVVVDLSEGTIGFPNHVRDILLDAILLKAIYLHLTRMLGREGSDDDSVLIRSVQVNTPVL